MEQYVTALTDFKIEYCYNSEIGCGDQIDDEAFDVKSKFDLNVWQKTNILKILTCKTSFKPQNVLLISKKAAGIFFYSAKILGSIDDQTVICDKSQLYFTILDKTGNSSNYIAHYHSENIYAVFSPQNEVMILSEIGKFIHNKKCIVKNEHKLPDFLKNYFLL